MKIEVKVIEGGSVTVRAPKESERKETILEINEVPLKDRCKGVYIVGGFEFKGEVSADDVDDFTEELSYATCLDPELDDQLEVYDFGGVVFADIDIDEIKSVVDEHKHLLQYFTCSVYYLIDIHKEVVFHESDKEVKVYEEHGI